MIEFERPTPQQRLADARAAAKHIGNNPPVSVIFNADGWVRRIIGIELPFPQNLIVPNNQNGTLLNNKDSGETTNSPTKTRSPMKPNQARHSQNLGGLSGWYKGIHYENGRPAERNNTNGSRKNGNGKY